MQARGVVLSLLVGVALVAPSSAQAPAIMPTDEYVGLFTSFCLQKFPDDSALSTEASAKGTILSVAEVKDILHDDPGRGWLISGQSAKFILTDEAPPYHSCALRQALLRPLNGDPFFAAARAFVAASGETLGPVQIKRVPRPNGVSTLEAQTPVLGAKGQPTSEAYMFIDVSHPHATRDDGSQMPPYYDVRFVRQIHP